VKEKKKKKVAKSVDRSRKRKSLDAFSKKGVRVVKPLRETYGRKKRETDTRRADLRYSAGGRKKKRGRDVFASSAISWRGARCQLEGHEQKKKKGKRKQRVHGVRKG